MSNPVTEAGGYKRFTATTTIATPSAKLLGIFVASASGATITVSDGATTAIGSFAPVGGTFYPMPFEVSTSIVITITGTIDATALYTV